VFSFDGEKLFARELVFSHWKSLLGEKTFHSAGILPIAPEAMRESLGYPPVRRRALAPNAANYRSRTRNPRHTETDNLYRGSNK
jgi:hypothetical protein